MNTLTVQNIKHNHMYSASKQSFNGADRTVADVADRVAETMMRPSLSRHLLEVKECNHYKGEPIDLEKAYELIKKVANDLKNAHKEKPMTYRGDVVNWCFDYVFSFSLNPISKDYSLSKSTRDAIIVEYLNRVGSRFGFNLALKTEDLL